MSKTILAGTAWASGGKDAVAGAAIAGKFWDLYSGRKELRARVS